MLWLGGEQRERQQIATTLLLLRAEIAAIAWDSIVQLLYHPPSCARVECEGRNVAARIIIPCNGPVA